MPDHIHLILNPRDGRIKELTGALKSLSAKRIVKMARGIDFSCGPPSAKSATRQVWQESFKDLPLWSSWMIRQKINYIHANPVKAGLAGSARDYRWSSYHAFYVKNAGVMPVDTDWWWPDDAQKLKRAVENLAKPESKPT